MKRILLLALVTLLGMTKAPTAWADNWDQVMNSDEYYKGVGRGKTMEEARKLALQALSENIAVHVSSEFNGLIDETHRAGTIDHRERVLSCVRTYSSATLKDVKYMSDGNEPNIRVLAYMFRSMMEREYEERTQRALQMTSIAAEAMKEARVDMALQYYYYAYSLVRSLKEPTKARDSHGRQLIDWLPMRIKEVLGDIRVSVERREDDNVDLLFSYKGRPVSSLDFNYSDGRNSGISARVKDGRGVMEMSPSYETNDYHLSIEYEYKSQARGDELMESVLDVIPRKAFREAAHDVRTTATAQKAKADTKVKEQAGVQLKPSATQAATATDTMAAAVAQVTEAIRTRQYNRAEGLFTLEGLNRYNKLIRYGKGRIVGNPQVQFFKGLDGQVVARGMQMSFSFARGTQRTFVEDVVLTFNKEGKICNVTFGLGQVAENDILCKHPKWSDDTRELLLSFLENYKTAYCLMDYEYIRDVFADDAVIIVGSVVRRKTNTPQVPERPISLEGQEAINYNRYDKQGYLKKLRQCFQNNEMINLRFSQNDIQKLDKFKNEELFGITIGQEYNSTTYADKGYLYLLVNMTNHDEPQIKIRTWQPNEVDMSKVFNSGYFYE